MRRRKGVMKRGRAEVGFTLVELIAAVALLIILLGILFVVFGEAGRTVRIGKNRMERYRTVRAVFRLLEEDITSALLVRDGARTYGFYYDDTGSPAGDGLDPAFLQGNYSDGTPVQSSDRLTLIRLRRGYDATKPGFMEVCYFRHTFPVNQGIVSRRRNYLFRAIDQETAWPNPVPLGNTISSALGFTVPVVDNSPTSITYYRNHILGLGVSDLQFRYMKGGENNWLDTWNAGSDGLPQAVEVTIRVGPDSSTDDNDHETFTQVIFLPSAP